MVAMSGAIIPEPLGDAGDAHLGPVDRRLGVGALGEGVGGHDRPRRRAPGLAAQALLDLGEAMDDLGVVQQHPDDPGGGDHHVALAAVEALGGGRADPAHGVGARLAGEGVGAAGVDHRRADALALGHRQVTLAPVDGGRSHAVAGEHPGGAGALGEVDDQQVVALVLVEAGPAGGELDAGDRRNGRERHGERRDQHTGLVGLRGRAVGRIELAGLAVGAPEGGAFQGAGQGVEGAFEGLADHLDGLGGDFQRLGGGGAGLAAHLVFPGAGGAGAAAGAGLGAAAGGPGGPSAFTSRVIFERPRSFSNRSRIWS
jgi:hypothetical protein